jgi:hypothetical protein
MASSHAKFKIPKKRDRKIPVKSASEPLWLRWLTPAAKKKAKAKLRRSAGRAHREMSARRHSISKGPKRLVWRVKPPRIKPASKVLSPVFVKGNRFVYNYTGYPTNGNVSLQNQLVNDSYEWLTQWDSVHGDFKHPYPHQFKKTSARYYNGYSYAFDKHGNGNRTVGSNLANPPVVPAVTYDPSTYNNALGRLYDQIRGDLDISIDLAEVSKTKRMMADTLRGMKTLATTFRKMRRSNPRDWGNLWLEWTYGWKPLASSIYQASHKLIVGPQGPRFFSVQGKANSIRELKVIAGDGKVTTRVIETSVISNRCRIRAKFAFTASALDSLAGFTSLNPVSIAWELTPYSFVVDWFVDFGGYLRNYENACLYRSDFVSGYVSEGYKAETFGFRSRYTPPPSNDATGTYSAESMTGFAREIGFRRYALSSVPHPRAPRFDPKLGVSRLLSAAALLGQFVEVLGHTKAGTPLPRRLTEAEKLLNAPKGASKGPFAWFFR